MQHNGYVDQERPLTERIQDAALRDDRLRKPSRDLLDAASNLADDDGMFTPPWEEWAKRWGISQNSVIVRARRLVTRGYLGQINESLYQLRLPDDLEEQLPEDEQEDLSARVAHLEGLVQSLLRGKEREDAIRQRIADRTARIETMLSALAERLEEVDTKTQDDTA